jgi:Tol biopolymer transport system component
MALVPGTKFGVFEIAALIGSGGMGDVYRARDTRLGRDVALKVLPDALTRDPDRIARFEREARTLASLNHPQIAHVYGLEEAATSPTSGIPTRAIVMELVEGEDLSDRIARGAMPLTESVSIARQIAEAIGSAHAAGIVHRDLKPSNIRIRADGTVKVLDFGLAKGYESSAVAAKTSTATALTTAGETVLGTAAYMSPEQARGQPVDARTDIWSFGCVLYEMLAGRQAFPGATGSDIIAKILEREPDWDALPSSTPTGLRRLLNRCLVKDVKLRLHALVDAHFELDEAAPVHATAPSHPATRGLRIGARTIVLTGAAATLLAAGTLWWVAADRDQALPPMQVLSLTPYPGFEATPTFSPDGQQVAFSWDGEQRDNDDIYVLLVGADLPHRLTTSPARDVSPAWKPDGSQIAFARLDDAQVGVYVASPLGGAEQRLATFPPARISTSVRGTADPSLSWSPDGRWLAVTYIATENSSAVYVIAHDGSHTRQLLPGGEGHDYRAIAFSPKGDALAFVDSGYLGVMEIDPKDPSKQGQPPRRLGAYQGYVGGLAWTLDARELIYGRAPYAAPPPSYLWRLAVDGSSPPQRVDLAGVASFPAMSPAGHRLAFSRRDFNVDMLLLYGDKGRDPVATSTFNEFDASFSPDQSKIAFSSDRTGDGNEIWIVDRDGAGRRPLTRGAHRPEGSPRWSPDGRRIAFDGLGDDGQRHVFIVDEVGGPIRQIPSKPGSFDQLPSWSRNGEWLYFGSSRSGAGEIWRVLVAGGEAQQITRHGGDAPFESWDGRTLYFSKPTRGGRSVFAMRLDGGPERALGIDVVFWNYFPGERGLYFASLPTGRRAPYSYEVRLLHASGKISVLHEVRLASMSPGLSATGDGSTILIAGVTEIGQDLLRIENFR